MLSAIAIGLRTFLLLAGAVVLGLSVTLAKQQEYGKVPAETGFSSFAGAFGIITCAIGLIALWMDKIPAKVVMGIDALASVFYLAGGIALTIALKDVSSCTNKNADSNASLERYQNKLLNGGCIEVSGGSLCSVRDDIDETASRCQRVQADYVFEFLGFAFGIAAIALGWMLHKRGGRTPAAYV